MKQRKPNLNLLANRKNFDVEVIESQKFLQKDNADFSIAVGKIQISLQLRERERLNVN